LDSVCRSRSSVIIEKAKEEEDVKVLCAGDLKKSFLKFPKHPKRRITKRLISMMGFAVEKAEFERINPSQCNHNLTSTFLVQINLLTICLQNIFHHSKRS
jgi:hypothetical protein